MSESNDSPTKSAAPLATSLDRTLGLGLLAVSFAVALGLSWNAREASMPRVAKTPAAPSTDGLPGFPTAVPPAAIVETARRLTERDQFVGMAMTGVKADGTLDVNQGGSARFVFRSLEGQGPEPEREYGTLPARRYCGFQVITLDARGLAAQPDVSDADCRRAIEPLPPPTCTVEAVWNAGKQKGADPASTASIEYYRASSGPAWFFQSGAVHLWLGSDCVKELTPDEARSASGKRVPG